MKRLAVSIALLILVAPFVAAHNSGSPHAHSVPILLYHGIVNGSSSTEVNITTFAQQMYDLKRWGWRTVTLEDYDLWLKGQKELPPQSFLLTIDDGRKDSFYMIDPILKARGFTAVMFSIGKYNTQDKVAYYLDKSEMQKMIATGRWEVQSHSFDGHRRAAIDSAGTRTPILVSKLWIPSQNRVETDAEYEARVRNDLLQSKEALERNFSIEVTSFAFPFGAYGQNVYNHPDAKEFVLDETKNLFDHGFYQVYDGEGYTHNFADTNGFLSKRISVSPKWDNWGLNRVMTKGLEKPLPYGDKMSYDYGWMKIAGVRNMSSGVLNMRSLGGSGAAVFLDGTRLWEDYNMNVLVKSFKGQTFTLYARYLNEENHARCDFAGPYARAYIRRDGVYTKLGEGRQRTNISLSNGVVGAVVDGDQLSCTVNGAKLVNVTIPTSTLDHGGIGIKAWAPFAEARAQIDRVNVTAI